MYYNYYWSLGKNNLNNISNNYNNIVSEESQNVCKFSLCSKKVS